MKNDTIWLENTSNTLPFNYMGTFTQNRLALAVDGDKSKLVSTPKLQLADVLQQRTYHFSLDDGNWQCDAMLDLRGQDFEKLQYYVANGSKSEQEKEVISQVKVNQFQLDNWRVVDPNRDSTNIKINASGKCPAQIREIGNIQVINPLKIAIADFEAPSQRKLDVRFSFPINEMNKSIYQLASLEDKKVQLPENVALDSKYGRYTASYVFKNHKIEVKEHLVINSGDIVLDEYSNFYNFIKSIFDHKKKSAIIIK